MVSKFYLIGQGRHKALFLQRLTFSGESLHRLNRAGRGNDKVDSEHCHL